MIQLQEKRLKEILDICNVKTIKYIDGTVNYNGTLANKEILEIDDLSFDDFILKYANESNIPLLYNSYEYETGLESRNEAAIRKYGINASLFLLPFSDAVLGLIGRFLDESYEPSSTYKERSYELYKLICMELDDCLVVFDMNDFEY